MTIIKCAIGTVFRVNVEEWAALQERLAHISDRKDLASVAGQLSVPEEWLQTIVRLDA